MDIDGEQDLEREGAGFELFSGEIPAKLSRLNHTVLDSATVTGESRAEKVSPAVAGSASPEPVASSELAEPVTTGNPLRLQYVAEVEVIRRKLGSIEDIRGALGLSRRQMCRLLLVDPSSWTRWVKEPERVPFYIYRALQWYLALLDKDAAWHPQHRFGSATGLIEAAQIKARLAHLEAQLGARARSIDVPEPERASTSLGAPAWSADRGIAGRPHRFVALAALVVGAVAIGFVVGRWVGA
jgi:hypothetical protein